MISAIVGFLNTILLAIDTVTHNYGLSIIILTVLLRLITWPLMNKQLSSAKAMQELQPEIKKIQEKYKNDKEKLNAATLELWKEHKVNPMAGCLPLIIQMPVLWAMFQLLRSSPELAEGSTYLLFGVDMRIALKAATGWTFQSHPGYWILVIVSAATTFYQQRLMMTDKSQQAMMIMMPLMLLYFSITFQAGLVLYWIVNNLLSVGQHLLINRRPAKGAVSEQ